MDQPRARLRINLTQREFEVEGSEDFVQGFAERFQELLEEFENVSAAPLSAVATTAPAEGRAADVASSLGSFGEYIMRLPSNSTDVDKMLAAGYFVQQQSADDAFGTADANKRLTEQGIKLGNPSQCVKQSLMAKRVFMISKGRYRVSQPGRAYLRQLLGPIIPE
ncbi:hypothetical protein [Benzoatithermus flavus]|uniref:Uncharacterized protein n=1 Tax=Benzoatithermus flavus TaxID=3108223 RepID=A0ABU8XPG3_9PROT